MSGRDTVAKSSPPHRRALPVLAGAISLLLPIVVLSICIGYLSYWTIPPISVTIEGDPLFAYDPEIGYVARPSSATKWMVLGGDGTPTLQYSVFTTGAALASRSEARRARSASTSSC